MSRKLSYIVRWAYVDTSYWDDGNRTRRMSWKCASLDEARAKVEEIWSAGHVMAEPVVTRMTEAPITARERGVIGEQLLDRKAF